MREPDEVLQGSIPSSVNLPLSTLPNSLHLDSATFKKQFGFTKPRPNQEIIFYCRSGKRSASACDVAKRNGYTEYVVLLPFVAPSSCAVQRVQLPGLLARLDVAGRHQALLIVRRRNETLLNGLL